MLMDSIMNQMELTITPYHIVQWRHHGDHVDIMVILVISWWYHGEQVRSERLTDQGVCRANNFLATKG